MAAYRKYAAGWKFDYKDSRDIKKLPYRGYHIRNRSSRGITDSSGKELKGGEIFD